MSKPKDPRSVMIDFILNQPIDRASDLLHVLTEIVKARAKRVGQQTQPSAARSRTRSNAQPRAVSEVDPSSLLDVSEAERERTTRPPKSTGASHAS
jgi:hypothetical protein